jgi:hypothetical protein
MRGAAVVLLGVFATLLAGCNFRERELDEPSADGGSLSDGPGADGPDGAVDAVVDAAADARLPDANECAWELPTTNFDPCSSLPASNGVLDLALPATFDTDSGEISGAGAPSSLASALLAQSGAPSLRVLVFSALTVRAPLRIVGSRPALIVALDRIEVSGAGRIDVSADLAAAGAGGNDEVVCATGRGDNGGAAPAGSASGGAGGGGYGENGGRGGAGGGSGGGGPGPAGMANGSTKIMPLRGGCNGGPGGPGGGTGGALGGGGGGALQLAARVEIVLETGALLLASGGGGAAPDSEGEGGGGGGSGGAILLESPRIRLMAGSEICANGGSGGEGDEDGAAGSPGNCSREIGALTPDQSTAGGDGGNGGFALAPTGGFGGMSQGGGGGGGGAVGRVRLHSTVELLRSGTITPEPIAD